MWPSLLLRLWQLERYKLLRCFYVAWGYVICNMQYSPRGHQGLGHIVGPESRQPEVQADPQGRK